MKDILPLLQEGIPEATELLADIADIDCRSRTPSVMSMAEPKISRGKKSAWRSLRLPTLLLMSALKTNSQLPVRPSLFSYHLLGQAPYYVGNLVF